MAPDQVRVIIVDDHKIFRSGLKLLISTIKGVEIAGEADNGMMLRKLLQTVTPDIIIMDINMPMEDGISASYYVRENFPGVRIIAMTMYNDSYTIEKMLGAGAIGYLTKDVSGQELERAIQAAMKGERFLSHGAEAMYDQKKFLAENGNYKRAKASLPVQLDELTSRELEILKLLARGYTSKAIAENLDISQRTVEVHRTRILRKMGVSSTTELLYKLSQLNLI